MTKSALPRIPLHHRQDRTTGVPHHANGGGAKHGAVEKSAMLGANHHQIAVRFRGGRNDLCGGISLAQHFADIAAGAPVLRDPGA